MSEVYGFEIMSSQLVSAFSELGIEMCDDGDKEDVYGPTNSLIGNKFCLWYNEPNSKECLFIAGIIQSAILEGRHLRLTANHHKLTSISFILCDDGRWEISDGEARIKSRCAGKLSITD